MSGTGGTMKPTSRQGAALPPLRIFLALGAAIPALALAGCTSTGLGDMGVDATLSLAEPALPETVDVMPTLSAAPVVAVADAVRDGAARIVASAYAGPSPTDTAAGLVSAGRQVQPRSAELDALIARYARVHGIPEDLLRRVVKRESTFNPAARNGPYWGLMQIRHDTAQGMGYRGPASGLLDAETNLIYAGKYLRGAFITADGNHDLAVRFYSRGYYYDAKRKGLLEETGLRPARTRMARSS